MAGEPAGESEVFVKNEVVRAAVVAMTGTPLCDENGELTGGMALLRDVTRQRKLEQQLAQAQKMEAIGLLAGGVAHDFNNLLAVIASCADLVFGDLPPGDPLRPEIVEIIEATRRASSLTRQLLAFSRQHVVEPKILDLNAVVSDTERMLRRVIGEDIELEISLSPSPTRIRADAGQVEQVILNLAVNARDAMPEGGKLTIATGAVDLDEPPASNPNARPGPYVTLSVVDTGVGMSLETQRRAFEPFFTTKDVGKGTGLGLSTVYGIAVQCGGSVDVQSEVGKGAVFRVQFPRVDADAPDTAQERKQTRPAGTAATILVVEDDEAVRRVAVRILQRHGYNVLDASSASEARRIVAQHGAAIDLLLTDVVMPETSGPRLVQELSASHPNLRVLYMSGYPGGSAARSVTLDVGAPMIPKPFTPASLIDKVREML
jgi:signal transduction histidine kinase